MPLTIKLNDKQFTLSNECLLAFKSAFDKTRVKERGMMLCQNTEVTPAEEIIGGSTSIKVKNCVTVKDEVIKRRPPIGFYHTHPVGDSAPSWYDAFGTISRSIRRDEADLDCRSAKRDGRVRCDTVKEIPTREAYWHLTQRRPKMKFTSAEDDPEIWQYFTTPFSFPVSDIPEIVRPTKIREEHFECEGRKYIRYFDTLTRRQWTVEVKA